MAVPINSPESFFPHLLIKGQERETMSQSSGLVLTACLKGVVILEIRVSCKLGSKRKRIGAKRLGSLQKRSGGFALTVLKMT